MAFYNASMTITLTLDEADALRKEDGIWVFRTGKRIPQELTDKLLDDLRSERDMGHTGKSR